MPLKKKCFPLFTSFHSHPIISPKDSNEENSSSIFPYGETFLFQRLETSKVCSIHLNFFHIIYSSVYICCFIFLYAVWRLCYVEEWNFQSVKLYSVKSWENFIFKYILQKQMFSLISKIRISVCSKFCVREVT